MKCWIQSKAIHTIYMILNSFIKTEKCVPVTYLVKIIFFQYFRRNAIVNKMAESDKISESDLLESAADLAINCDGPLAPDSSDSDGDRCGILSNPIPCLQESASIHIVSTATTDGLDLASLGSTLIKPHVTDY